MNLYALRFARNWKLVVCVSAVTTTIAATAQKLDWLGIRGAEIGAYDQGLTVMTGWAGTPRSDDVVILAIDDLTFQGVAANPGYAMTFGTWPYSRNVWARVFEHLAADGARAIVFDAVMDERHTDPSGDLAMASVAAGVPFYLGFSVNASQSTHALPKVIPKNALLPAPPETPAKAAAKTLPLPLEGVPEAAPEGEAFPEEEAFPEDGGDGYPKVSDGEIALALAFPIRAGLPLKTLADEKDRMRFPQSPIAPLIPAAKGFGLVLMEEDGDGKMRRTRFAYTDGVNDYVTLPVAVAADLFGATEITIEPRSLTIGNRRIAINPEGDAEIDFKGDLFDRFRTISLLHVLDDWAFEAESKREPGKDMKAAGKARSLPPGTFKDKVVIIGGFALGTADVKGTPFTTTSPGVVKQAAEIQNLLDGRFIVEAPFAVSVLVTFVVAFLSITLMVVAKKPALEIAWPLLLFYGFFLVTGVVLVFTQIHVLSAMPAWAASTCALIGGIFNNFLAPKDRARLRGAFANSMGGDEVDLMVEQKVIPSLAGESRELTVLITDIRDFGNIARTFEKDPAGLASFLNGYLTKVTKVLLDHGGCIDKYEGDSIFCLFGAPSVQADHAMRAARAALAVQAEVARLQQTLPTVEQDQVFTRIGIHTATMFVGNFGSDQLVDYTAVGDGMLAALRIERANDGLQTTILMGPATTAIVQGVMSVREAGRIPLADGAEPSPIYELMGIRTDTQKSKVYKEAS